MSDQPAASTGVVSTPRLVVRAVMRTDVGLVRSENQDFGLLTTPDEEKDSRSHGRLLIVADGMGGHRGGATASRLAGETVKAQFLGSETADIAAALRDSLTRANARIYSEAQANPDLRGMGTTTSALAVRGTEAWFAHVGDSRIYMVRGDQIRQLTDDHSLVASMVREGLLTSKEAETHPRRNVLQRSMGVSEDVEIDVRGPFQMLEGDTFILCSDGLHGLVKEDELKEVAKLPIGEAADEFVRRTLERGAPDNVTVIVARVMRSEEQAFDFRFEDTQPMPAGDPLLFDETQRDTSLVTAAKEGERSPLDDTLRVRISGEFKQPLIPTTQTAGSEAPPASTAVAGGEATVPSVPAVAGEAATAAVASPVVVASVPAPAPEGQGVATPAAPEATSPAVEAAQVEATARVEVPTEAASTDAAPDRVVTAKTLELPTDESTVAARTLEVPADDATAPDDSIAGKPTLPLRPLPDESRAATLHRSANEDVDVIPAASGSRSGGHSVIKWMLIVVLALSAACAWLLLTR